MKANLLTFSRMNDAEARTYLERLRWPDGPVCPHCGVIDESTRMKSAARSKNKVRGGLYNCRACRKPFTVTVGTIFEGSHIPLSKWLVAFYLFASSKKSVSALQLQRQLDLGSYRSAWHMAHRIRLAMANEPSPPKLTGDIEADETYISGKPRHRRSPMEAQRHRRAVEKPVAVLVQRDGPARALAMRKLSQAEVRNFIEANVDLRNSRLLTDESLLYRTIGRGFGRGHDSVHHKAREYAREDVHNNTAESFNGLFQRCIDGAWHHISPEHIGRYVAEEAFRFSHRKTSDGERTAKALGGIEGIRLYYRRPMGGDQARDQSLLAR